MPAANIIELRQLLAERFPGLRTRAAELSTAKHSCWPTGVPQLDASLRGGLSKGTLAEIVAERPGCGSTLLMTALIHRALGENKFTAVIDGQDSLDVTQLGDNLSRLLWVRCRSTVEALKAAEELDATVADARFCKPLDKDLIRKLASENKQLVTIEEGAIGGFAAHVMEFLAGEKLLSKIDFIPLHLPDIFQDQDSPHKMYDEAGLNAEQIIKSVKGKAHNIVPLKTKK